MPKEPADPQAITRVPESSKIIGKYELLELIGDGAEGRIFKARCIEEGVTGVSYGEAVALKRLRNTGHDQQSLLFDRQTKILRSLTHENIISYKDSFVWREDDLDHEVYCLVTELLEGETLKSLMERNSTGLPWAKAREILHQTLLALEYASTQEKSVVHRDLKPSNIYITHQGVVKLIDFGISRPLDSGATSSAASFQGTWDYMAPDFVHQQNAFRGDEQSDIFSFGVCLYQVLTGRLPFPALGDNPQIAYFQRWYATDKLPEVEYRHSVFRVLNRAGSCIGRCLAFKRDVRYRSFKELLADFSRIQPRKLRHRTEEYEYVGYLGQGGFGQVFRARRLSDGYDTAIKEMLADRQAGRFVREAKVLQYARHPHLVEYVDFVEVEERQLGDQRRFFLVLEYLKGMPGASLRDRIKNSESGMNPEEVMRLFTGYLDCLEHLHQKGIIHRDIKPGNLYALEGEPDNGKIFDLGIAHDEEGTRTHGQVPGTLDYMPPEFATQNSGRGSVQSDIYSIGVTLYQALTKKLPFPCLPEKESEAFVAFYQRSQNPPDCSFEHPVFIKFPELMPLFRRALAPDLTQRHESAKALRDEVRQVLGGWDSSKQKGLYDAAMSAARAAWSQENYEEAEQQANRALALSPGDQVAEQVLLQAQAGKRKGGAYDGAPAAAREMLSIKKDDEAEKKAQDALKLRPGEATARELSSRAEKGKREEGLYRAEIKAAQEALENEDYEAAEKHAQEALVLRPADTAATHLLLEAQEARKRAVTDQEPPIELEPTASVEKTEEVSTEETTPASLERIEELQEAEEKRAQEEKEEREQGDLIRREKTRQVAEARQSLQDGRTRFERVRTRLEAVRKRLEEARRRRIIKLFLRTGKIAAVWVLGLGIVVGLCVGLISGLTAWEKKAEARSREKLSNLIRQGRAAEQNKDWAAAINQFGPAVRLAQELKDETERQSAQRELDFAQLMEAGERFLREKKPGEAEREADKALAQKRGDSAASDLKKRAKDAQQLAVDETKGKELQRLMTQGELAEQRKDWASATNSFSQALTKAEESKDEKGKQEAQKELKYAQAMEAGERFVQENKFGEAELEAEKALAQKPSDLAANDLKKRAIAVHQMAADETKRKELRRLMDEGEQAKQKKNWTGATNSFTKALSRAEELNDGKGKLEAQKELRYAQAMEAGERFVRENKLGEAELEAEKALAQKPGDLAANDLMKRAKDAQQMASDQTKRKELQRLMADGRQVEQKKNWTEAANAFSQALSKAEELKDEKAKLEAQKELSYAQAMEAGERFVRENKPGEAELEAEKALAQKPGDLAANDLKKRAKDAQQMAAVETKRNDFQRLMIAGGKAELNKNWTAAANAFSEALSKAEELQEEKRKQEARKELEYARAMEAGERFLRENKLGEAEREADKAIVQKPGDSTASDLKKRAKNFQQLAVDEAKRKDLQQLMKEGEQAESNKNWAAAANSFSRALSKADELKDENGKQSAQKELDYARRMDEAQAAFNQKDFSKSITQTDVALKTKPGDPEATKLKGAAQEEQAYQGAEDSFARGDYETALSFSKPRDGTDRFDKLSQRIRAEQGQLNELTAAMDKGQYDAILQQPNLPDKPPFKSLKAQADDENRTLQDATQKLASGDYVFIETLERQKYKTKAPFVAVLAGAGKERDDLNGLQRLKTQNQRQPMREQLAKLAPEVRRKKPFAELDQWAQQEVVNSQSTKEVVSSEPTKEVVNSQPTSGVPAGVDPTQWKPLEQAEFLFKVKTPPPGTKLTPLPNAKSQKTEVRRVLLGEIEKIQSAYKASGRLPNEELDQRLKALREAIDQWAAKK